MIYSKYKSKIPRILVIAFVACVGLTGSIAAAPLEKVLAKAQAGDLTAQIELGEKYTKGDGVPQDRAEALKWYRKAAELGNAAAQLRVGKIYSDGIGVPKDRAEAAKWFRMAAEQGITSAQYFLALMYQLGEGVPKDRSEAAKWYREAAAQGDRPAQTALRKLEAQMASEQGDADAQYELGKKYAAGEGVPKDLGEALKRFRKAADQGHELGKLALKEIETKERDAKRRSETLRAAKQGDAAAQRELGLMYLDGDGVPKDLAEAAKWLRAAAEQGDATGKVFLRGVLDQRRAEAVKAAEQGGADAHFELGLKYCMGDDVPKNFDEAVTWFRKAAEQGHVKAQLALGGLYYQGDEIRKNFAEAEKWYRKAAEQGNPDAQYNLGFLYFMGQGVRKDGVEGMKWIRKAAEGGNARAQCILGLSYSEGEGVPKDLAEAVKWCRKAAEGGSVPAQAFLKRISQQEAK